MRNLFPGNCLCCGVNVERQQGFFQKIPGKMRGFGRWKVRCVNCVGHGNNQKCKQEVEE